MLKRILLTLIFMSGLGAFASDNFLNSIVLEKADNQTSVILRSDEITRVKREIETPDKIVVTLKNIKQSPDISTLYKNVSNINGIVVQNNGNDLKLYMEASDISKANIVFETPNSAPITVEDNTSDSRILWSIISVALLLIVMYSARNINIEEQQQKDINELIKEREKALYRNFQKEVATLPSLNYRLKSYSKHVLKGETIRSYENRFSLK